MAMHTYPAEERGHRFQIATEATSRPGVMSLAISRPEGGRIVDAEFEPGELNRARFTGRVFRFAENAFVQYKVISNGIAARIGFLFGFEDGDESYSVMVENDGVDWLFDKA